MTDQEINVAIHEARGLCPHTVTKYYCFEDGNDCDSGFTCVKCGKDTYGDKLPSYTTDLNAMAEAEKYLEDHCHVGTYLDHLEGFSRWSMCHATARQRAEAFLRTLGKWKE